MNPGAKRCLVDWAHMILPALLFVALKASFRGAAGIVAGRAGIDASLGLLAADAFSLTVVIWIALKACASEIVGSDSSHNCSARRLIWCAAIGAAAGLAALWIGRLLGIHDGTRRSVLSFVVLCLLGPVAEEIIYRGLVLGRGKRLMSEGWAIVVSALIFGASHGSPLRMALAAAAGVLLGCARLRGKTILAPILVHAFMNGIQFPFG